MPLIFGFDIGTTSIGSAVIDHDREKATGKILRMGVRIFPETREPKSAAPLNQTRRAKRMMRRQLRRRRERRKSLNTALAAAGLLPRFGSDEWDALMRSDPYALRARALDERLEKHEFGRAIYHLAQRRHFRGRDLEIVEDEPDDADDKAAEDQRQQILKALKKSGKTLGQWLHSLPEAERKRGIHASRGVVEDEFERIWKAQSVFHDKLTDSEFESLIRGIIFFQRPVFWRKNTLGQCPLVPDAKLSPKGSWLSFQRRMLEQLNNLALAGAGARPLDDEERAAILEVLQRQISMTWAGVRKSLRPVFAARGNRGEEKRLKFNLEIGGEKRLIGNPVEAKLSKLFGREWHDHPHKQAIRDAIHERIWRADYKDIGDQRVVIRSSDERIQERNEAAESFVRDFQVPTDIAEQLSKMTFPSGWEPYSIDALQRILPELEKGVRFGQLMTSPEWEEWRNRVFPERERPTGEIKQRLPSPAEPEENRRLGKIRNPTVVRCQNELRKVVNNLIDVYGKPDLIRVELTRDVSRSKRDREEFSRVIRKREAERRRAVKELEENGISEPSRIDVEKWLLWQECGKCCPYTGDIIGFDALFREGAFEIEHIWPRSRCLDNSFVNKSLCRHDINAEKGNRTPYEYLGSAPDRWHAIQERLTGMVKKGNRPGMAFAKVKRFLATEIPEDFASRQLNDTGYAARQAVAMLKQLWPDGGAEMPVTVQVVSGRVTSQLRRFWGMNNLLHEGPEKTRADHRHHAVDALVVACTHQGITGALSRYWKLKDQPSTESPVLPPPWPTIRKDTLHALDKIVVSHRVQRKLSGALHEETVFGDTGEDVSTKSGTYRQFTRRKPVDALSKSEIEKIRDPVVRKVIREWVEKHGGDPKKAFSTYPRIGEGGPEIRKVRLLDKQQPNLMVPLKNGYAKAGDNHHITIYKAEDGQIVWEVVSLFHARRRQSRGDPVVQRTHASSAKFLFSLGPGDSVIIENGEHRGYWTVTGAWADGRAILERSIDAVGNTTWRPSVASLLRQGARKVSIDPIGRVRAAAD